MSRPPITVWEPGTALHPTVLWKSGSSGSKSRERTRKSRCLRDFPMVSAWERERQQKGGSIRPLSSGSGRCSEHIYGKCRAVYSRVLDGGRYCLFCFRTEQKKVMLASGSRMGRITRLSPPPRYFKVRLEANAGRAET